jgi:hypothetical protein
VGVTVDDDALPTLTRNDPISIWEIDLGDQYGRSDLNEISIVSSIWNMGHRYWTWYVHVVIYHFDMVILDIELGYGLSLREMTVSIWDILSLRMTPYPVVYAAEPVGRVVGVASRTASVRERHALWRRRRVEGWLDAAA